MGTSPEVRGRGEPPDVSLTNSLLRFRSISCVEPEWALLVFRRYMRSGRFTRESRITTNIAHPSASRLRPIEFPLPSLGEQHRIVAEHDSRLSFIHACEQAVEAALDRSAALRRSVLKAAFAGQLVPQDPTDEPASVLLERIRAERAAAPKRKKRRTKSTP